jgi:SM-20-related protein
LERATLRLKGGNQHVCELPVEGPLFRDLLDCMQEPARMRGRLLQMRSPEGIAFDLPAEEIAAVELPPPHFLVEDFLTPEEADYAMAHALAHEHEFTDATISAPTTQNDSSADYRFRRSRILNNVADVAPMVASKLPVLIPKLWAQLRLPNLALSKMEIQVTAHGDGDFFNTHTDNGLPDIAHRHVSYVYYFHRMPKQFSGGHLRFYNTLLEDGFNSCGALVADIEPPSNSLMIFPSHCHHEVTPIQCGSAALQDQRLTLNGWVCT